MEAFILTSAFTGTSLRPRPHPHVNRTRPTRHVVSAKRSSQPPLHESSPDRSSSSSSSPSPASSSSFAGMAAGPGAPTKNKSNSLRKKPTPTSEAPGEDTGSKKGPGDPAGPGGPAAKDARVVRALGQKKERARVPEIRKKSAADFIAEGVVDDMEEEVGEGFGFEEADIRFGIADMVDPFKVDAEAGEEQRRASVAEEQRAGVGKVVDVTGDGGVRKKVVVAGEGEVMEEGARVTVEYTGRLEGGKEFDSSRKRDGGFTFELGTGTVIKGWEAGVATMRKGEVAEFQIEPGYAYGRRGMPPVIPGAATLTFEIELVGCQGGAAAEEIRRVADYNPTVARTPEEIAKEYDERMVTLKEERKNRTWLERMYFISPFASQTGERPPWWINPNITFVLIAIFCGLGFYLVLLSGAIHQGYVEQPIDVNIFK